MRRSLFYAFLLAALLPGRGIAAQEAPPAGVPRYRLIQVVETATLQERCNEAAGAGYRLVALAAAPGGSIAAIMEKVETPAEPFRYAFPELKLRVRSQDDLSKQLFQFAAQGFHLHTILGPPPFRYAVHPPNALLVMEKPPGTPKQPQYQVLAQGMGGIGSFNKKKIASLMEQGFHLVRSAWMMNLLLIFEKIPDAQEAVEGQSGEQPAHSPKGYHFLVSRWAPYSIPAKELLKAAAEGDRCVVVFRSAEQGGVTAMTEHAAGSSAPYEYMVLKSERLASGGEEDLNGAGEKGFRLFRQNSLFIPFVMEKVPGGLKRFQYKLLQAARLADLSEKLEEAGGQGYQVVAMSGIAESVVIVMEKSLTEASQ